MKARFFIIPAIVLAAVACQKEEDKQTETRPERPEETGVYTLTIQASKDVDTKALDLSTDGKTLTSYWLSTEKVQVYKGTNYICELGVTLPANVDKPATATLSGTLTDAQFQQLSQNDQLTLLIPRTEWKYTGQVGTLESIQTNYDYATSTVTISGIDNTNKTITTSGATFQNEQSIYRFAFKKGGNAFSIKDFSISSANNRIVSEMTLGGTPTLGGFKVTPASATNAPLFVAIRNTGNTVDTYNFIITGGDDALYSVSKEIPADKLDKPRFISAQNLELTQPKFNPADGEITSSSEVL